MSETFDELKKLHQEYFRLSEIGLVGLTGDCIIVTGDLFKAICKGDIQRVTLELKNTDPYLTLKYKDNTVTLITVL